jgi:phosphoribosylamine---glycine ligase
VELFLAASQQRLSEIEVRIDPRAAATVVAVSGGYPGNYEKGFEIDGLDILQEDDVIIFHAGTAKQDDVVVTNGGRVLAVTSFGDSVAKAARRSSDMMEFLDFHGIYYRRDIGYEFV